MPTTIVAHQFGTFVQVALHKENWKNPKTLSQNTLDDYESGYNALLEKSSKTTMEVEPLRTLAFEMFKIIYNGNPRFMKNIFKPKSNATIRPMDHVKPPSLAITF